MREIGSISFKWHRLRTLPPEDLRPRGQRRGRAGAARCCVRGEPGTWQDPPRREPRARARAAARSAGTSSPRPRRATGSTSTTPSQRLHDSRFGGDVSNIDKYIKLGPLGEALAGTAQVVLLVDEIDKADIEFPNDLLLELDAMQFRIDETDRKISARERPVVVITSNNEKELPDAFLRRCVFHYISVPRPAS